MLQDAKRKRVRNKSWQVFAGTLSSKSLQFSGLAQYAFSTSYASDDIMSPRGGTCDGCMEISYVMNFRNELP